MTRLTTILTVLFFVSSIIFGMSFGSFDSAAVQAAQQMKKSSILTKRTYRPF